MSVNSEKKKCGIGSNIYHFYTILNSIEYDSVDKREFLNDLNKFVNIVVPGEKTFEEKMKELCRVSNIDITNIINNIIKNQHPISFGNSHFRAFLKSMTTQGYYDEEAIERYIELLLEKIPPKILYPIINITASNKLKLLLER